uniref:ANK_REP_REGION domain-containing protein n=1 Tax=Trichuris muris TaxID=70415 RepID=A0A5S6QYQ4_TRIMR
MVEPAVSIVLQPARYCRFADRLANSSADRLQLIAKVTHLPNAANGYVLASLFTDDEPPREHINSIVFDNVLTGSARRKIGPDGRVRLKMAIALASDQDAVGAKPIERTSNEPSAERRERKGELTNFHPHHLNAVRIGVRAVVEQPYVETPLVLSSVIRNCSKDDHLKIEELSQKSGDRRGGETLWLRCHGLLEPNRVLVLFHEPETGWEGEGKMFPEFAHQNILVKCLTPAYMASVSRQGRALVNVSLVDKQTGACGMPVQFGYDLGNAPDSSCAEDRRFIEALHAFASNSEVESFVFACKHLLATNDEYGNSILHKAVRNRQPFALRVFLKAMEDRPDRLAIVNRQNFRSQTALHLAVRCDEPDCVHYLMAAGADRRLLDYNGCTVAHQLSDTFNEAIYKDILFPPNDSYGPKQNLDLSILNKQGKAAIHLAVARRKVALLEALIEAGADVDQPTDVEKMCPLHLAIQADNGQAVEMLLKAGASVESRNANGETPVQLAKNLQRTDMVIRLSYPINRTSVKREHNQTNPIDGKQARHSNGTAEGAVDDQSDEPAHTPHSVRFSEYVEVQEIDSNANREDFAMSIDYLTRVRLSRLLDNSGMWKQLATHLNCGHMVDFIQVCYEQDQSSPTMLLLDQYGMMENAAVSDFVEALENMDSPEITTILNSRWRLQQNQDSAAVRQQVEMS